ncbi:SLATT domain-containing protein [Streptosporangium saharense]|uniref:SLATT domain-containing protein n=1 Tax=Streptosporangium saharense TaxID=1706840 RepID=UPI0036C37B2F
MIDDIDPYLAELDSLYEDASYSAQSYFEAAKSAEFWGKSIVFVPALMSAVSALLVALGWTRQLGAVGAIAGAIAATAAFLGSERRASSHKETGRQFTKLRHEVRFERSLAHKRSSDEELEERVRILRDNYNVIVSTGELVSNRFFSRAQERIKKGVLSYNHVDDSNVAKG